VKTPLAGDRFHFNAGVAANGGAVVIGLCPDIG
jgi:hypothetical protein